jgi:hypothetical protein
MSAVWVRAFSVAMKIVSSPEIVPTTSGHSALSMPSATLCAAPVAVRTTVIEEPARRTSRTNCASCANWPRGGNGSSTGST